MNPPASSPAQQKQQLGKYVPVKGIKAAAAKVCVPGDGKAYIKATNNTSK
jgi:hypothetical protein